MESVGQRRFALLINKQNGGAPTHLERQQNSMGQPKVQKSPSKAYNGALEALCVPQESAYGKCKIEQY